MDSATEGEAEQSISDLEDDGSLGDDADLQPIVRTRINLQKQLLTTNGGSPKYYEIVDAFGGIPNGPSNVQELACHTNTILQDTFAGESGFLARVRMISFLERGVIGHFDYAGTQGQKPQ